MTRGHGCSPEHTLSQGQGVPRSYEHRSRPTRRLAATGVVLRGFLAKDRYLPPVHRGDLLAVFSAGAYGFVMASQYNSRPPEIFVNGEAFITIRSRETYDDLLCGER